MEDKEIELLSKTIDIIKEDVQRQLQEVKASINKLDTEYDAVLKSILTLESHRQESDRLAGIFRKRISTFSAIILVVLAFLQFIIPYLHLGV